jgi:hypothetical protein
MVGFAYGPWLPDVDDLNSTTTPVASGCLPTARGWGPWPSLSAMSGAVPTGPVRGAFMARTSTGSAMAFCGTATKLYKLAGSTWTDVSRTGAPPVPYALPVDNYWSFDQQDKYLYAVQAGDVPQVIDIDAGANFTSVAALAATLFPGEALGTPPTARYVKSVGGFLFLMDLTAPVGSIVPTSGRIQFAWSGYRNPFAWKYGERSSDTGTLPSGGFIMGMSSPETGLMVQQNAVSRFVRVDDRRVWDFATIESQQGTRSPYSLVEHQGVLYYYGVDGFIMSSAAGFSAESGIEAVDEWFKANVNLSRIGTMLGAKDPTRPRVWWAFPTVGNSSYTLDHVIGYDVSLKRFFHGPLACTTIFQAATIGTTLEGLGAAGLGYAMDAVGGGAPVVPYSLDSDVWQGGVPQIGGFDAANKLGFLSGAPVEAMLKTGRIELMPGMRSYVNGWRPQTDAATVRGRIATSEMPQVPASFSSSALTPINPWGVIEEQVSGRVMAFEATIPAGTAWTSILGLDFDDDMVKSDGRA